MAAFSVNSEVAKIITSPSFLKDANNENDIASLFPNFFSMIYFIIHPLNIARVIIIAERTAIIFKSVKMKLLFAPIIGNITKKKKMFTISFVCF